MGSLHRTLLDAADSRPHRAQSAFVEDRLTEICAVGLGTVPNLVAWLAGKAFAGAAGDLGDWDRYGSYEVATQRIFPGADLTSSYALT